MRVLRTIGLIVVVAATGLLSGGAAGADSTTAALLGANSAAPAVAAPAAAPPPVAAAPATGPVAVSAAQPAATAAPTATPTPSATPAPTPTPAPPPPTNVAGTPCSSNASACVDLASNQAWLVQGGEVQYGPVPITSGRKGFRTSTGTFRVSFRSRDHVSSIYDAEMPYSVFFNGGVAFHQGSLSEKSHGCIHLSRKAASTFFDSLSRGDVVQVVR